jgi:hypothetical protein
VLSVLSLVSSTGPVGIIEPRVPVGLLAPGRTLMTNNVLIRAHVGCRAINSQWRHWLAIFSTQPPTPHHGSATVTMRLLYSRTLQFREFVSDDIPKYAILSHRWESHELSYQDLSAATGHGGTKSEAERIRRTQGFKKIDNFGRRALKDGYEYIWADTCCIDKSSSAELQEAINSMYRWYQKSGVCYAYLADVSIDESGADHHDTRASRAGWIESFKASEWFFRGWTLQELLAPRNLVFVDRYWRECDLTGNWSETVCGITGIPTDYLSRGNELTNLWEVRVARRMAWAASRKTTRIEDSAYSLLGLFDVYMPMLYGEGQRAFQRLQEEIMNVYEDSSILAWSGIDTDRGFAPNGLAQSPAHFQRYPGLINDQGAQSSFVDFDALMTPRGLLVSLKIQKDLNDPAFAYAVLMDTEDQRLPWKLASKSPRSLVLPIMFTRSNFSRAGVKNECVRFSDPFWVSSGFVRNARLTRVCFIRHVQAADINRHSSGFSLCSRVWAQYATAFTYPLQTRPGHRHIPAIFGGLPTSTSGTREQHTLVWELVARTGPPQRFGILVDYRLTNGTTVSHTAVTVIKLWKPMNMPWACHLASDREYRRNYTRCNLLDHNGTAIPSNEIVSTNSFQGYWIHAGEDAVNTFSSRLATRPMVRELNGVEIGI